MSSNTKKLVKSAIILSIVGLLAKILAIFFKIPLNRLTGDIGLGYYSRVYPIYTFLLAISLNGAPSAISKMVSEKRVEKKYFEAHKIFQYTMILFIIIGSISTVLMYVFSDFLIKLLGNVEQSRYALYGLALSPVFAGIMGTFRGYFQGMQNMKPTAISQIVEAFVKVTVGISLVYLLLKLGYDIPVAVGGACLGVSIASFAGAISLGIAYLMKRKDIYSEINLTIDRCNNLKFSEVVKRVLYITFPIAIGSASFSIMNIIDSNTISNKLKEVGLTQNIADILFGQKAKAETLLNIPLTISLALVISLVPAVAEAVQRKDKKELFSKLSIGTRLAILVGLPASAGLFVLAKPILKLVYSTQDQGDKILAAFSLSLIFIILGQVFTSMLQGIGKLKIPLITIMIAAVIKLIGNNIFINETLLINGAAIGSILGYGSYALMNYYFIKKYTGFKINTLQDVLKPVLSSVVMCIFTKVSYDLFIKMTNSNAISALLSIIIGMIVYIILIFITKAITEEDIVSMPHGQKLLKLFKKLHLTN